MSEETNNVLVVISIINDEYRIKYNPLIPNKIGEQSHNEPHKKARF